MKPNEVAISRAMSHALRHEPWLYELELDDEGWTAVDDLLAALRKNGADWSALSRDDLERAIALSDKKRHEIDDDQIRALYGHSLPGRLRREAAAPPARLYHGTAPSVSELILREGLKPMSRQYVHLSADLEMARQVGSRKAPRPILLRINAEHAHRAGTIFYMGNERVWLADFIAPQFLCKL